MSFSVAAAAFMVAATACVALLFNSVSTNCNPQALPASVGLQAGQLRISQDTVSKTVLWTSDLMHDQDSLRI